MATLAPEGQGADAPGLDAREYLRALGRRRWTILLVTMLCTLLALAYALAAPKNYSASSTVLVKPVTTDWASPSSAAAKAVDLPTEQSVAASDAVAEQVRNDLHLHDAVSDLQSHLAVSTGTGTATTLTFTFTAPTASGASGLAAGFAKAYLARRQAAGQDALAKAQTTLRDEIGSIDAQLSVIELRQPDPRAPQTPSESIAVNQSSALRDSLNRLSLATVDAGAVIKQPLAPSQLPRSPSPVLLLAAGVMLGLLLGVVLAYVHDRLSDRVFLSQSAVELLRPAVLETVPLTRRALRRQARDGALALTAGPAAATAAFGRASERFRAMLPGGGLIVVTSLDDRDASAVAAANIAAAWAQTGTPVTLLTGQEALVGALIGASPAADFADLLRGDAMTSEVGATARDVPDLRIVPLGGVDPMTLRTNLALEALRALAESSPVLVVDAPGVMDDAAGLALSARADLVLITVIDRTTSRTSLLTAAERVAAVGPALVRTLVFTPMGSGGGRGTQQRHRPGLPLAAAPEQRAAIDLDRSVDALPGAAEGVRAGTGDEA